MLQGKFPRVRGITAMAILKSGGHVKRIHWFISDLYFWLYVWTGKRNARWFNKFINHEDKARTA